MYRGKYLTSDDDLTSLLSVRARVPELRAPKRDGRDFMAVYALAFDEADEPCGCGRLFINEDSHFEIDMLGVLETHRGKFIGDLLARMLLYKALALNAGSVYAKSPAALVPFFARYGFVPLKSAEADADERLIYVAGDGIRLEGACSRGQKKAGCDGNCEACASASGEP